MQFVAGRSGSYRIQTSGALDTVCRLLDTDGTEVAQNDDGGEGLNCQIDTDLTQGRRYFLHVRAFGANATGDYEVALTSP